MTLRFLLVVGGVLHLGLVAVNLAVPVVLNYRKELGGLRPFVRRLFWIYAAFILLANLGFGLVTLAGASDIARGTRLGTAFAGFVACYWGARLVADYISFDWSDFPRSGFLKLARHLLDALFLYFVAVYGFASVSGLLRGLH